MLHGCCTALLVKESCSEGSKICLSPLVGQIRRKEFQRSIYLRQLMHQQVNHHDKQENKLAQLFAALYLACSGRDGHEKENLRF